MGSKAKEEALNSLIRLEARDVLLIQETKLEDLAFLQASRKFLKKMEHMQPLLVEHQEDLGRFAIQIGSPLSVSPWTLIGFF